MSNTPKKKFEQMVLAMQADLRETVKNNKAGQKTISARLANINKMVDFYEEFERLEQQLQNAELKYNSLHDSTQRLVIFSSMHGVSPEMVFYYGLGELKEMQAEGIQFRPPVMDLNKIIFKQVGNNIELEYPGTTLEQDAKVAKYSNDYFTLKLAAGKRC